MTFRVWASTALLMALAAPAFAKPQSVAKPRLVIAISVDQLSSDLFARYRPIVTGGLKTLSSGVVFESGYQSHAATETCPGHSTILSGIRPARSGIIGNDWFGTRGKPTDGRAFRDDVYCVEDAVNGKPNEPRRVSFQNVSADFKTLGDRLKARFGARSRVFGVGGKDRAATLMAGKAADQVWWYDTAKPGFVTYLPNDPPYGNIPKSPPAIIATVNQAIVDTIATKAPPPPVSADCAALVKPILVSGNQAIGATSGAAASNPSIFRATPELDSRTLEIAEALVKDFDLGAPGRTDVLAISLSVTDYVGHSFGSGGPEMCMQMAALDARLDTFLKAIEARNIPFVVALTADHGGHDVPERGGNGLGRSPIGLGLSGINEAVGRLLSLKPVLDEKGKAVPFVTAKGVPGDLWLTDAVPAERRADVVALLKGAISGLQGVEAVFTRDEIMATPMPKSAPDRWSQIERVRASYMDGRSGALYVVLKEALNPIAIGGPGYVATHGSSWDYDRRVPILFWQPGMATSARPEAIETVDILPTLAALVGLPVPPASIDGQCRDLDPGPRNTCP